MTWRELAMNIMAMPDDVMDTDARIWFPHYYKLDGAEEFPVILTVGGFDGDMPIDQENFPSLDVDFGPTWC